MARIIETKCKGGRRTIRLSSNDIINIVQEYQNIAYNRCRNIKDVKDLLSDVVLYLPEDV